MLKISVQKSTLSTQNKTGNKAFECLGCNCLLCQSTVLQITQLLLEEQNALASHPLWPFQKLD